MATVRISGTTRRNIHKSEWLGAPRIDPDGRLERSIDLPEATYQRIEEGINQGYTEGMLFLDDGRRVDWFLDRDVSSPGRSRGRELGSGEGI